DESNAALSFRNIARVAVLAHESVGVADLLGAASVLISQAALDALGARASGGKAGAETVVEAKPAAKAKKASAKPKASKPAEQPTVKAEEPVAEATDEPAAEAVGAEEAS
ncbi:MAG TPA: hypothetical protein VGL79_01700, partial [Solirubrobacteraceae bacterium]